MEILYESVSIDGFYDLLLFIVPTIIVVSCAVIILCIITEDDWNKACTVCICGILITMLFTITIRNYLPRYRTLKVDVSSVQDWDELIKKYEIGSVKGKILNITEREPVKNK